MGRKAKPCLLQSSWAPLILLVYANVSGGSPCQGDQHLGQHPSPQPSSGWARLLGAYLPQEAGTFLHWWSWVPPSLPSHKVHLLNKFGTWITTHQSYRTEHGLQGGHYGKDWLGKEHSCHRSLFPGNTYSGKVVFRVNGVPSIKWNVLGKKTKQRFSILWRVT